jgi:16S rRNA (cytosine967-C5)-methyltransferase
MKRRRNKHLSSRGVAAEIVGEWLATGAFPDRLLESVQPDRAFVMELVYGAVKWKRLLEWVAARYAKRGVDTGVIPYLLVGLYQILLMDHVAEYAAVNETVEAAKADLNRRAGAFVNAVLRGVCRDAESIRADWARLPTALAESHPDVLVSRWVGCYGEERTRALCRWNNGRPDVTIRPRCGKATVGDYLALLKSAGIEAMGHPYAPDEFIVLPHGVCVTDLPGYAEGWFGVQDPSTACAVALLNSQANETILDACAAPGGKTFLIADKMGSSGRIVAMDLYEDRLTRLKANVRRLNLTSVNVVQGDAAKADDIRGLCPDGLFDRVLLDVPCTNTGVLRRRADARWRFTPDNLAGILATQRGLLDVTSEFLKPGGVLVYSTCSLEPEEGSDMVQSWLKEHPLFALETTVTLFPPETQTDGIYAAALRKTR